MSEAKADRDQFLAQLDPDVAKAEQKYRVLRSKLVFYFQHYGCGDPESLADEVFLRVLRRLHEGADAYSGINAYCYGVADFVLREYRRRPRQEALPDELPQKTREAPHQLKHSEQVILVQQALKLLPPLDSELFTRYHLEDREELAAEMGLTPNALRVQVFRIRQRLKERLAAATARDS